MLPPLAKSEKASVGQAGYVLCTFGERLPMAGESMGCQGLEAHATHLARGTQEASIHEILVEPQGFEELGAKIARHGADAQFGHDLEQPLLHRRQISIHGPDRIQIHLLGAVFDAGQGEPGKNEGGSVADQAGQMMIFSRFGGVADQGNLHSHSAADQVVVYGAHRQQHGDRGVIPIQRVVSQDDQCRAFFDDAVLHLRHQLVEGVTQPLPSGLRREAGLESPGAESWVLMIQEPLKVLGSQDGRGTPHQEGSLGLWSQGRSPTADDGLEGEDQPLPQRVHGGIGHLGEALFEIAVEELRLLGQDRQGGIIAHGADGLVAAAQHRFEDPFEEFPAVSEGSLGTEEFFEVALATLSGRLNG